MRMVARSSLSNRVFSRYARTPRFMALSTSLSQVVRMMVFAPGNSLRRIALIASKPFTSGICRSISVMFWTVLANLVKVQRFLTHYTIERPEHRADHHPSTFNLSSEI